DVGAGIYNDHATLSVSACALNGNSALGGGGIYNDGVGGQASLTISASTLSSNSANVGGGIANDGSSGGSAGLTIRTTTLSGNSAGFGGAILNDGLKGIAAVEIEDTILDVGRGSGGTIYNSPGTITSRGYNLSSDSAGPNDGATDRLNTNPMLGPLQDNGGPTFTHALLAGSPAIDAGDPAFVGPPDYDQRGVGFPRVVNGRIDIGAFEVQTPLNSTPQVTCPAAATLDCQPSAGSSLQIQVRVTDPDNDKFLTIDLKEGT